jgi:hypothetical protein
MVKYEGETSFSIPCQSNEMLPIDKAMAKGDPGMGKLVGIVIRFLCYHSSNLSLIFEFDTVAFLRFILFCRFYSKNTLNSYSHSLFNNTSFYAHKFVVYSFQYLLAILFLIPINAKVYKHPGLRRYMCLHARLFATVQSANIARKLLFSFPTISTTSPERALHIIQTPCE